MKRFNFRLQRVLDIKLTVEKAKNRDFLAAYGEWQKTVNRKEGLITTIKEYLEKLHIRKIEGAEIHEIKFFLRYFQMLENQISFQYRMIDIANEEMEKRRAILIEAVKDRKILERLRDKKQVQYFLEYEKEEQLVSDEISGGKFFHNKKDSNPLSMVEIEEL